MWRYRARPSDILEVFDPGNCTNEEEGESGYRTATAGLLPFFPEIFQSADGHVGNVHETGVPLE
jgi:hypothetical protein